MTQHKRIALVPGYVFNAAAMGVRIAMPDFSATLQRWRIADFYAPQFHLQGGKGAPTFYIAPGRWGLIMTYCAHDPALRLHSTEPPGVPSLSAVWLAGHFAENE